MSRGQIVSGDFIISIAIFLVIIAILIPLFNRTSDDSQRRLFLEELKTRSSFVTDLITKTPGIPEYWNKTTVVRAGFVNKDGHINRTKIKHYLDLSPESAKSAIGLEELELNMSFYRGRYHLMTGVAVSPAAYFYVNDKTLLEAINGSGLVWDLYYGGSGSPESGDSRNVYSGAKEVVFDQMIVNSTAYRTIIIENPELTQPEVDVDGLGDFVRTGGILIYEGGADLIESGFSMSSDRDAGSSGIVRDKDFIDSPIGSVVSFAGSDWYFYESAENEQLHIVAEDDSIPGGAFIGYWNHGAGLVYYVTDIEGTVDGKDLLEAVGLIGKKAEFVTSIMKNSIVNTRPVVFSDGLNSLGRLTLVVGR